MSRRRAALLAALGGAAVAALVPAYAVSFASVYRQAGERAAWSRIDRELGGAEPAQVDTRIVLAARRHIPRTARFSVVTGVEAGATQLGADAFPHFSQYALLPRRRVDDGADADWIIAYGTYLAGRGVRFARVVRVAPGFELGEVRR